MKDFAGLENSKSGPGTYVHDHEALITPLLRLHWILLADLVLLGQVVLLIRFDPLAQVIFLIQTFLLMQVGILPAVNSMAADSVGSVGYSSECPEQLD